MSFFCFKTFQFLPIALKVQTLSSSFRPCIIGSLFTSWGFPDGSVEKNLPSNSGDVGLIPGSERSPGEGNGNPLQYSCLGNPMDRGAWWAIVHGVTESDRTERAHTHIHTRTHLSSLSCNPPLTLTLQAFILLNFVQVNSQVSGRGGRHLSLTNIQGFQSYLSAIVSSCQYHFS